MSVVIETTIGDFTVDLYTDERPQTCRNFLKLCKSKYYNWSLFHTVQSNFIAQTGDPTGTGKGGESIYGQILGKQARYYEAEQIPKIRHGRVGLLSMVNCGDNLLGSQFFITLDQDLQSLDSQHCVFGEIAEGLDIVLKFNEAICDKDHRPYQDIRISHTVILDDPYDDPDNFIVPERSPSPTQEFLSSDRIGADECLDDTAGMTMEEIIEMRKEKEAKAAATILEIVGDIPDADIAPPENVLFVCKLNPVTNDDDLEIIFSRFGKIIGCEVIRDHQTGDSLQYAFIEFADQKSCEEAYFKMDNVLIDDRRIHVDFSQSVSHIKWRGKGRGYIDYSKDQEKNKSRGKYRGDYAGRNNDRFKERRDESRYDRNHSRRQEGDRNERNNRRVERSRSRSRNRSRERKERRERSRERKIERKKDKYQDKSSKHKRKRSRDRSLPREKNHKKKSHKKHRD